MFARLGDKLIALIVLYFDGSLRHQMNPEFPSERIRPRSACCACIIDENFVSDEEIGQRSLMLGGKMLDCSFQTTSGEAEYQGLLLGLDGLSTYFNSNKRQKSYKQDVRVFGDCKTVLHQMNGLSLARKLRPLFDEAQAKVQVLSETHNVCFRFTHIPRAQNQLCDGIAAIIVKHKEYEELCGAIQKLGEIDGTEKTGERVEEFLGLDLSMTNFIPFSKRRYVYQYLANLCFQAEEFTVLVSVGEQWARELKLATLDMNEHNSCIAEAVLFQLIGLQAQKGRIRQIQALQRKHRFLLDKYADVRGETLSRLQASPSVLLQPLIESTRKPQIDSNEDIIESIVQRWYDDVRDDLLEEDKAHWLRLPLENSWTYGDRPEKR